MQQFDVEAMQACKNNASNPLAKKKRHLSEAQTTGDLAAEMKSQASAAGA